MRVAVLGCGPAGLMAAHAVNRAGHDVTIYSKKRPSQLYGTQYLHEPIPGITDQLDSVMVKYQLLGTYEQYKRKVYGDMKVLTVSPEDYVEPHKAWNLRSTYKVLYDKFEPFIADEIISPKTVLRIKNEVHLIISSIPKPALCVSDHHDFRAVNIYAIGDAPGKPVPFEVPLNTIIANGLDEPAWYRASNVFGVRTVEWVVKPPLPAAYVSKPISNNCDCWPMIVHVGRYGSWKKGVLSHHAYEVVQALLSGRT